MALGQSPCRKGRKITSQNLGCHTEENNDASSSCLVSFCRDTAPGWCWLDGTSSLEIPAQCQRSHGEKATALPLFVPDDDLTKLISHLQQSSYIFSFEIRNVVLLQLYYFMSCTRNAVWHSLGPSRLWFTVVINIPKYTCKLNDTLIS